MEFTEDFFIALGFIGLYLVIVLASAYSGGNAAFTAAMETIGGIMGVIGGFYFSKTQTAATVEAAIRASRQQ